MLNKVFYYISIILKFIPEVTLSVCDEGVIYVVVNKLITKRWFLSVLHFL